MGDPREDNQQAKTRKQAAQERAARGRVEKTTAEAEQARVSVVEPEAHKMKHGDNAILPSYNVQLSWVCT
jgi:hypothetical protein